MISMDEIKERVILVAVDTDESDQAGQGYPDRCPGRSGG